MPNHATEPPGQPIRACPESRSAAEPLYLGLEGVDFQGQAAKLATRPSVGDRASLDTSCIFCMPGDPSVNHLLSQHKSMYARFDNFPASTGHIEVVPFRHVQSFFELSRHEHADMSQLSKAVRNYLHMTYKPDGYTIGINDGSAAGRTVPHLHMHIIPRWFGDVPDPRGGIRQIFPDCNPDNWR